MINHIYDVSSFHDLPSHLHVRLLRWCMLEGIKNNAADDYYERTLWEIIKNNIEEEEETLVNDYFSSSCFFLTLHGKSILVFMSVEY